MGFDDLRERAAAYYSQRLQEHGVCARGVDWRDETSQHTRFRQLLTVLRDDSAPFTLIDYGCGYGALFQELMEQRRAFHYVGYDAAPSMILASRQRWASATNVTFTEHEADLAPADYAVASGVWNVRGEATHDEWLGYLIDGIKRLSQLATRGFAFNALTAYSDEDKRRRDLYYADPLMLFDHVKRHHANSVTLIHDYPLWEFTIVAKKN